MATTGKLMRGILLSGGLDSLALAYWQKPYIAFTIDYGQKSAKGEIRAAAKVVKDLGMKHEIIKVDLSQTGSGDLLGEPPSRFAPKSDWWPFRNQVLLSIACSFILSKNIDIQELLFGTVKNDLYHKDGTRGFFDLFNRLLQYQEGSLNIATPAINLTTVELIQVSQVPYDKLIKGHSCHKSEYACGQCRGCFKYQRTLHEIGYPMSQAYK